jgi:hypothetical protein
MAPKKPNTQREMLEQLWYAMIGTNGDGVIEQIKMLTQEFQQFMRTRADTCPVRMEQGKRRILPTTWIMFAVALAALATTWILKWNS